MENKQKRATQLFEVLKKAHDLYDQVDDSKLQSEILDGVLPVMNELAKDFGVNKTWLISLVIWGKDFFKSEKDRMYDKDTQTDEERYRAFSFGKGTVEQLKIKDDK